MPPTRPMWRKRLVLALPVRLWRRAAISSPASVVIINSRSLRAEPDSSINMSSCLIPILTRRATLQSRPCGAKSIHGPAPQRLARGLSLPILSMRHLSHTLLPSVRMSCLHPCILMCPMSMFPRTPHWGGGAADLPAPPLLPGRPPAAQGSSQLGRAPPAEARVSIFGSQPPGRGRTPPPHGPSPPRGPGQASGPQNHSGSVFGGHPSNTDGRCVVAAIQTGLGGTQS